MILPLRPFAPLPASPSYPSLTQPRPKSAVNVSRADLCELLAIKLLSAYGTAPGSLELLHVLTTTFNPFAGASCDMFTPDEGVDEEELARLIEWGKDEATNALELGIFSKAKRFVKSPLGEFDPAYFFLYLLTESSFGNCSATSHQSHLRRGGHLLFRAQSVRLSPFFAELSQLVDHLLLHSAFIQDSYKTKPVVEVYDFRKRPFLDHHRLRVPSIRTRLEFLGFASMLVLFLLTQTSESLGHLCLKPARNNVILTLIHLQPTTPPTSTSSSSSSSSSASASSSTNGPLSLKMA